MRGGIPPGSLDDVRRRRICEQGALLEFRIEPRGARACTFQQLALFQPRKLFGLLYWYAVLPLHDIVFRSILLGIRREAVQIAATLPEAAVEPLRV